MNGATDETVLYTAPTPNGWKVSIALEELDWPYRVEHVRFELQQQRTPAFLALNPNGRIPVLDDGGRVLADANRQRLGPDPLRDTGRFLTTKTEPVEANRIRGRDVDAGGAEVADRCAHAG